MIRQHQLALVQAEGLEYRHAKWREARVMKVHHLNVLRAKHAQCARELNRRFDARLEQSDRGGGGEQREGEEKRCLGVLRLFCVRSVDGNLG